MESPTAQNALKPTRAINARKASLCIERQESGQRRSAWLVLPTAKFVLITPPVLPASLTTSTTQPKSVKVVRVSPTAQTAHPAANAPNASAANSTSMVANV